MLTLVAISIPQIWSLSWTAVTITPTDRSAPVAAVYSIGASYCTCRSSSDWIFSLVWDGNRFSLNCFDSIFFFEIFISMSNDSKQCKNEHDLKTPHLQVWAMKYPYKLTRWQLRIYWHFSVSTTKIFMKIVRQPAFQ